MSMTVWRKVNLRWHFPGHQRICWMPLRWLLTEAPINLEYFGNKFTTNVHQRHTRDGGCWKCAWKKPDLFDFWWSLRTWELDHLLFVWHQAKINFCGGWKILIKQQQNFYYEIGMQTISKFSTFEIKELRTEEAIEINL